ncbi:unnamed protein product [Brassica rapa]|uniref:F-box domain-containing protein n=1 Tax=Brassica campestris TaxID=3711 RepID=A0A3P5ZTP0_BRACM|nr:unnamed protein product [Brassica rapa]VDC80015.1 unnamed protein product [Brassica rapa]
MDPTKKLKKEIMAHEKLPWELTEEILSRVSPKYLVPFRVVCKRWKAILDDKTFINNHKETFRFILATKSKIYSVSMDTKILVLAAVCNSWLKQTTWISEPSFRFYGIGHRDSNNRSEESVYKTIWNSTTGWKIHDLASVLRLFNGDRFSVLKQCYVTKKIEIWVTKNKVNVEDGNDVVWMNFMTFSIPNFPGLVPFAYPQQPSYFIHKNERLVVCFCDESGKAWIYVMAENKLIEKVKIESVVDPWPLHCTYFPNLVSVPQGLRDEAKSEV